MHLIRRPVNSPATYTSFFCKECNRPLFYLLTIALSPRLQLTLSPPPSSRSRHLSLPLHLVSFRLASKKWFVENLAPEQECHNTGIGVRELCIRKSHCRLKEGLKEAVHELELKNRIEISRGGRSQGGVSMAQVSARANAQRSHEQQKLEWGDNREREGSAGDGRLDHARVKGLRKLVLSR